MKLVHLVLALTLIACAAPAAAEGCAQGPDGNLCKAENGDPRAMYLVGREAYDQARDSGDFAEAYKWAYRSKTAGFLGGKMLLKMIHLQAGEGHHRDFVQAHRWLSKAIEGGDDFLVRWRTRLEAMMTPEQLAEANQPDSD